MAAHSSILAWEILWTESLACYSPQGRKEWDTIKQLSLSLKWHLPVSWDTRTLKDLASPPPQSLNKPNGGTTQVIIHTINHSFTPSFSQFSPGCLPALPQPRTFCDFLQVVGGGGVGTSSSDGSWKGVKGNSKSWDETPETKGRMLRHSVKWLSSE